MNETNDTIAAIATPLGRGGIGIIRLSGPDTKAIAKKILKTKKLTPRLATHQTFYNSQGQAIDEGIALFFQSPHSYTGEDVLELQGHGGPVVMNRLLREVIVYGARMAKPGEFTERAFYNDKMDLAQAESVADLINASSEQAARSALRSLQGSFSKKIQALIDDFISLRMMIEAAIDFPEEDIDFLSEMSVEEKLEDLKKKMEQTLSVAGQGALLQHGITVVIVGKPNAGKSSLLNCFCEKDTAIVTDIAGTTRDVLRENIHIDGLPIHVVDTAGLRDSEDIIEKEGMRRTWKAIDEADIVLLILDGTNETSDHPENLLPDLFNRIGKKLPLVIVKNKIDLLQETPTRETHQDYTLITISAKERWGIDLLKTHLKTLAGYTIAGDNTFLARERHCDAMRRAKSHLENGIKQLKAHHAGELLAEDLRQAQLALSEITGTFTNDDLLSRIFMSFCIGK